MKFFEATSTINATPERVWAVLIDGATYPEWDSGVERVEGTIADGETIKVFTTINPGRAFPVKVGGWQPNASMTWTGGMPLGLFRGVRTFILTPQGDGVTKFHAREEFTGPLLPMIWRTMPDLGPSFQQFADGLKQRAERQA